ncbi:MAG TPA: VOC family protein [Candidatus Deferrimicrobium sp.]|nr:VOC family protein [Candidatus Deferrimicrobium sp.]
MPRVVHFEIHCDDPERAARFYTDVFAWQITKWDGPVEYWLAKTGDDKQPGINGGLMKRIDPSGAVYNTLDVPDVDEYARKVESHGGKIVLAKHAVPGVGWIAYCQDTERNVFGIFQNDPSAK